MKNSLISVIIPTYGRSDSLTNAILSVENQTYKNIEIIVVDDNDSDTEYRRKNELLMKTLRKKYNNIKYIKHEKNKNGAVARNTGIDESSGKYIAFLDDDDEFLPNKIKKQYDYLISHPKYKCIGCGYRQGTVSVKNPYFGDISKEILTMKYCFTTSILLFEKDSLLKIGKFDERFTRHQDYELLLKFCRCFEVGKMSDILLIKGKNQGENIPVGKKAESVKKLFLESFRDDINAIDEREHGFRREVLFANYFQLFLACIKGHNPFLSMKYGLKSFIKKPALFLKSLSRVAVRKITVR